MTSEESDKRVFLAGQGHSDGGFHSMEVFTELEDAKAYAESLFNDEREWQVKDDLKYDVDVDVDSFYTDGEQTHYYGYAHALKGFVKEKELR